ncbi:Ff.00g057340.m01.CDS01 [Fusarium sp. VM40]|nr:Ff.00g057340.m01.CDS01 [Fusarium sp. VM40]
MPAKPAAGKPARGWDASSHEDLLLAILEEIKPNKSDLTSVAEKMRNKGYSYSYDAINQHVQKLRKVRDASGIQNAGSEPATPRKRAAVAKTPAKRAPKKKVAKSASIADDDDELEEEKMQLKMELDPEDDEMPSPSPAKRARAAPKSEPDEDSGSGNFEA